MRCIILTGVRRAFFTGMLVLLLLTVQIGCIRLFGVNKPPEVQKKPSRVHWVEGETVVSIGPLVDCKGEILGAVVSTCPYETALKQQDHANAVKVQGSNVASTTLRSMILVEQSGVLLVADNRHKRLDLEELAQGPWIYYLNEAEPFRRIPVPHFRIDEFKSDLETQLPLEFVAKWCDKKSGELLAERFESPQEFHQREGQHRHP